jgi:very-short-patch-repair endonuclease
MFPEFDFDIDYVFPSIYIFLNYFIYYSNIIFTFTINALIIILFFDYCQKIKILDNIKYELSISKTITDNSIKELKLDMNKLNKQIDVNNKFTTEQFKHIENNYERYKRDISNFRSEIKLLKNIITKKETEKDKILDSLSSTFETFCKKIEHDMELFNNDISSTLLSFRKENSEKDSMIGTLYIEMEKTNTNLNKIEKQCSEHVLSSEKNAQKIYYIEHTISELRFNTVEQKLYKKLLLIYPSLIQSYRVGNEYGKCITYSFFIKEYKIIIELDGRHLFEQEPDLESPEKYQEREKIKIKHARDYDYSIIRITEEYVIFDTSDSIDKIKESIQKIINDKIVQNIYICENNEYDVFNNF